MQQSGGSVEYGRMSIHSNAKQKVCHGIVAHYLHIKLVVLIAQNLLDLLLKLWIILILWKEVVPGKANNMLKSRNLIIPTAYPDPSVDYINMILIF